MRSACNHVSRTLLLATALAGCETPGVGVGDKPDSATGSGGTAGQNSSSGGNGGVASSGGASSGGLTGSTASGGNATSGGAGGRAGTDGGTQPDAGTASGGRTGSGGSTDSSGGRQGNGGATGTGGARTGGATGRGGATGMGGQTGTGGATSVAGQTGTRGNTGSGGSTEPCTPTWEEPPSDVAAWINESWNSQLGANVKNRKAWLLDSVMKGNGQINICVRWGATSAPSASVKANMASSAEKWFNDWFSKLAGYACFPHAKITTKVSGWAVKPGNESWVSDLDSSINVYTQTDPGTDPPGEPMCPSTCSFFDNWNHTFPNCPGGEAFHTDYWMWLDDNLPGSGAAAVGGDWGLRMPVSSFTSSMGKSNFVIEHEMGHGFGFQDYYEWTGSKPTGGSLMIVGSTSGQSPTTADQGLLRRTWKEMKPLRGW
jgi:hypothetical protein